jgi:formylglycine-generating enzyme required for sulfatase activity
MTLTFRPGFSAFTGSREDGENIVSGSIKTVEAEAVENSVAATRSASDRAPAGTSVAATLSAAATPTATSSSTMVNQVPKPQTPSGATASRVGLKAAEAGTVSATREHPFTNSLGMRFVPVPGTKVFFGVWDTRVEDYAAFAAHRPVDGSWATQQRDGVPVSRGPNYPVVGVSWDDARAFCQWLTEKESAEGALSGSSRYRLPTDEEWSRAVGLREEKGATPAEKHMSDPSDFPWGKTFPPPAGSGNYAEAAWHAKFPKIRWIQGYNDGFAFTSPVGSFAPNALGLYDMGGNVWQWCEDLFNSSTEDRTLRGGAWDSCVPEHLLSSYRINRKPAFRGSYVGFRCVLESESAGGVPVMTAGVQAPPGDGVSAAGGMGATSASQMPEPASKPHSHLTNFTEQYPEARTWALAPLDVAVPLSVLENARILKEGLAAEATRRPAAWQAVYSRGLNLSQLIFGALQEKDVQFRHFGGKPEVRPSDAGMAWWSARAQEIRVMIDTVDPQFREALKAAGGATDFADARAATEAMAAFPPLAAPLPKATPVPRTTPRPGEEKVFLDAGGPVGGTNFGVGLRKLKMHVSVGTDSERLLPLSVDCYWVGWDGKHHTTSKPDHHNVLVSADNHIEFDSVAEALRDNGATFGILAPAPGVYRGWVVTVHNKQGKKMASAANQPEFNSLIP